MPTERQQRLITEQLRRQAVPGQPLAVVGAPQRQAITEVEAGPVVVRVLGTEQPSQPSQSARDFLRQRLVGGVKRSADMLKPARSLQPPRIALRQQQQQQQRQGQRRPATTAAGGAPQPKRRR